MRLLVIIKNTPSSPINKRRRSRQQQQQQQGQRSAGRRFTPRQARKVFLLTSAAAAAAKKVSPSPSSHTQKLSYSSFERASSALAAASFSSRPQTMTQPEYDPDLPEWLLASFTSSPFVSVPAAPHNTSDFLMSLHSEHGNFTSSAQTTKLLTMGTGTSSTPTSSSSPSPTPCDTFDELDTFGSNFGLINSTFFQSYHDSFVPGSSTMTAVSSTSPCHSPMNIPVEAR